MRTGRASWTWVLNGYMLLGAVLGYVIVASLMDLRDAMRHRGPGFLYYYYGDLPQGLEKVSESTYKRHKYARGGIMLAMGLWIWYLVAKTARMEALKARAKEEYLEAEIRASSAYNHAFASAIDEATRERAAHEARWSGAFRDAQQTVDSMRAEYHALCRKARGDT